MTKTSAAEKPKAKSKKLPTEQQLDGKVEGSTPTTLEQVLGEFSMGQYTTADLDEYQQIIAEMNTSDLQAHAVKVGLLPNVERSVLRERLAKEFRKYMNLRRPANMSVKGAKSPQDLSKNAMRALSEGR
jgi:hypothetical protein